MLHKKFWFRISKCLLVNERVAVGVNHGPFGQLTPGNEKHENLVTTCCINSSIFDHRFCVVANSLRPCPKMC